MIDWHIIQIVTGIEMNTGNRFSSVEYFPTEAKVFPLSIDYVFLYLEQY